jgi:hypothetical protein
MLENLEHFWRDSSPPIRNACRLLCSPNLHARGERTYATKERDVEDHGRDTCLTQELDSQRHRTCHPEAVP